MTAEYFDVVIVGAGISGIGQAYRLQTKCSGKSYVILEGRDTMGGTWDLFRYPGIRSDSSMYTLSYNFKPWNQAKYIADGPSILKYIKETATENGIDKHIRYGHFVKKASWSSTEAVWTIEVECKNTGQTVCFRCNLVLMCAGYYSYEKGYTPEFKGRDRFTGEIVHPQKWPENLDYKDKKIVVIGSGATAISMIPELAKHAEHVVMLQRSPTYVISGSDEDETANLLYKFLPKKLASLIMRWKYVIIEQIFYRKARVEPENMKQWLLGLIRKELGSDYDVETHFTPRYNPWDQRLCLVRNGDLFEAIRSGDVSVITDNIDTFIDKGILLKSGKELEADIIITATGLNLLMLGGVEFTVDEQPVEFSKTYTYKGVMYSDVPNLVTAFGYINASWTLRADLIAEYICRLINHMDKKGFSQFTPRLRPEDQKMQVRPLVENFSSNYIQRVIEFLPKQGDREPWIQPQDYKLDRKMIARGKIEDGVLNFK